MCDFVEHFITKNPNDRNIFATGSRKNGDQLNVIFNENEQKTLFINSYTNDKIANQLQNVNELWDKYQNVIYTSSITVGVSYDSEKTFDNLFLHFSVFGCCVRDMFQASLRARKIKNETVYYTNVSNYFGNERPRLFSYNELMTQVESRSDNTTETGEYSSEWMNLLWIYNQKALNVNAHYHHDLINRSLLICGYKDKKI